MIEECQDFSKTISAQIKHHKHIFLIGSGLGYIIAKEGALKIKELTYMHCQCLPLSQLSNSFYNYARAHEKTPTIFIVLEEEIEKMND